MCTPGSPNAVRHPGRRQHVEDSRAAVVRPHDPRSANLRREYGSVPPDPPASSGRAGRSGRLSRHDQVPVPQPCRPRRRRRGRRAGLRRRPGVGRGAARARGPARRGPRPRRRPAGGSSPSSAGWSRPTRRPWRRWSPARSASRSPSRSARSRRSSTPATSSSARAAGCTGRPCRARCRPSSCSRSAYPVGVAVIVTAPNFPVAVPSWYLVPALLCGNAVVWKPAESTPAVAAAFTALFRRGRRARRACSRPWWPTARRRTTALGTMLDGAPGRQGRLHRHRRRSAARSASCADGTCSRRAWSSAARTRCWSWPTPTSTWPSRGRCSPGSAPPGQRCTSLGTVWVQREVYDDFRERFVAAVEDAVVGDPTPARPVRPDDLRALPRHPPAQPRAGAATTTPSSARPASAGSRRTNPRKGFVGDPDRGVYAHPTIVEGVRPGDELYDTETFGPLVGLGAFDTLDEALALANGHGYGLSSSIYTRDPQSVWRFRAGIGAGMVSVNNSTSGAEAHLPFGGNGRSGNGSRQSGHLGARPVHPVAGAELGLVRPPAEGPDGRRGDDLGPGVPAVTVPAHDGDRPRRRRRRSSRPSAPSWRPRSPGWRRPPRTPAGSPSASGSATAPASPSSGSPRSPRTTGWVRCSPRWCGRRPSSPTGRTGVCDRCGRPIPVERLEARPWAVTHVVCPED